MRIVLLCVLLSCGATLSANPRYQAIPLDPGYEFGTEKAFLLDTVAGHMWIWVESPASGTTKGGRYLIYQGQLSPGKDVGEIILQQEWQGQGVP